MAEIDELKEQIKWLEYNLAMANAEVKKGREIIEYVQLCDPYPDLSAFKYQDAFRLIRERMDAFYASYFD